MKYLETLNLEPAACADVTLSFGSEFLRLWSARITYVHPVCKIQGIQISSMSVWQSREYMQWNFIRFSIRTLLPNCHPRNSAQLLTLSEPSWMEKWCALFSLYIVRRRGHTNQNWKKSKMLRPSTQWSISSSVKKKHQHKDVSLVKQIQADSVLFCRSSKDFCRSALNLLPAWRADSLWPFKSFNCLGPMGLSPGAECNLSYLVVSRNHPDLLGFGHHPASSRQHRVQLHRLKSPQRSQKRWSMSCTNSNYHSCW